MHPPLTFRYRTPDDGPTLEEVTKLARQLKLTMDEFVTRAIVIYYEEAAEQLADPKVQSQFRPKP